MASLVSNRKRNPLAAFRPIGVHYAWHEAPRIVITLRVPHEDKNECFELRLSGEEFKQLTREGSRYLRENIDKVPAMHWKDVFSHPQQAAEFQARIV